MAEEIIELSELQLTSAINRAIADAGGDDFSLRLRMVPRGERPCGSAGIARIKSRSHTQFAGLVIEVADGFDVGAVGVPNAMTGADAIGAYADELMDVWAELHGARVSRIRIGSNWQYRVAFWHDDVAFKSHGCCIGG